MKRILTLAICVLLLSCNSSDDPGNACTLEFVYGLSVQVRDANTNGVIINNITVTAVEGSYNEELTLVFDTFVGAGERAGTYTLQVEADGYQSFTSQEITVTADACHVITENVEITLQPI